MPWGAPVYVLSVQYSAQRYLSPANVRILARSMGSCGTGSCSRRTVHVLVKPYERGEDMFAYG